LLASFTCASKEGIEMGSMIVLLVSALLALSSISLLKVYRRVPERELRKRAREGDELAKALYRAVAYGHSLTTVLWIIVGLANALFFVLVSRSTPTWFALIVSAIIIWAGFVWLPARNVTHMSAWVAARLAPALAWLLNYLHPLLDGLSGFFGRHWPVTIHTGLYDRDDILELLQYQQAQPDNRVEQTELEIAIHALTFGDLAVGQAMVPRRVVKMVAANEAIGPVMMSELHDSGFSRFPVYSGKKDNLVGILYLRDLVRAKAGGRIEKYMNTDVMFVHEEQPLTDALQAVLKTKRHLFIVVNSFEEFVGIITMEDVLERAIGKPIVDEFDQYDDMRAVAARAAKKEHKEHIESKKEPEAPAEEPEPPTEEPPEVVK
jgi:CBS domain containing-hemolysin-like protein